MERAAGLELLDGPLDDPVELRDNLRDLRRVNSLLGGTALSRRALDRLVGRTPGGSIRLLDVGTGGGDIALAFRAGGAGGWPVEVVAVDNRAEVIAAARALDPALDLDRGVELLVA